MRPNTERHLHVQTTSCHVHFRSICLEALTHPLTVLTKYKPALLV